MKKFLHNKKIGKKLQFSIGIIIAIFAVVVIVMTICVISINDRMKDFYERSYVNNVMQMEIRKDMQAVAKEVLWSMTTESLTETKQHIDQSNKYAGYVMENFEKLKANSTNTEDIGKLDKAMSELAIQRKNVIDLASQNKNEQALVIFNGAYKNAIENVQNSLVEIGNYQDKAASSAYDVINMLGTVSIVLMFSLGTICIAFSIYIGILITKSIKLPIIELEEAARKLSNGEMDAEIQYVSADELGGLADNFRTAFEFMKEVIADTSYMLGEISQGNLRIESEAKDKYVGEFAKVLRSFVDLKDNLNETMKMINDGSEQVAVGSTQMSDSAQSLAEGATEQAGAIEELTATVESVSEMAKDSAENAKGAARSTRQAAEGAQGGKESLDELVKAMDNINNVSIEIQNIIGAIEDIASQTNLLSLNASIEAARAGEAGKGFAVVAAQIGKLASDSAMSAVETRELIGKSMQEVENGNSITKKTVAILGDIIKSMHEFVEMAQQASETADGQAELLRQVQGGIEQIAQVVQSNSAAAQETSATSEELSAQSESLKGLVEQFKLTD